MHLSPSDPDLSTLVKRIEKKRLDLQPNFQRGEVWGLQKKQRLIDSILRGWHIPPIHVIQVPNSSKQEVLDGQQRLAAIRDFINGKFAFNANFEPKNPLFESIDGITYDKLDDDLQGQIDDFTIRIITISDYNAGEPGELFYRLNQPTNLTSAEQRNAYFGEARQQVKDLSDTMEDLGYANDTIGFSNSRMAYDDIIAKVLLSLESETLNQKITANLVTQRYRDSNGFLNANTQLLDRALDIIIRAIEESLGKVKLNKSTLFSWLFFVCTGLKEHNLRDKELIAFINYFERIRISEEDISVPPKMTKNTIVALLNIYHDRASSRVADISSVKLRDFILWAIFTTTPTSFDRNIQSSLRIRDSLYYLSSGKFSDYEGELNEIIKSLNWGASYEFI
ncbi:DUF262 domain-containing protein [Vibrio cyclitrophicus]